MFSIITPTFNRSDLIEETLDSVKAQTYRPIEIIVVDDGSTDDTKAVVDAWKERNEEPEKLIVRYYFQENNGQGSARNLGVEVANGELIQFLDSDDRISPERLETIAALFDNDPTLDFVQTGFDGFCAECGEVIEERFGNPDVSPWILAMRGRLWANTLRSAFRKSVVSEIKWNTEMTCFEDYEYVVRVLAGCRNAVCIRDISASARRGGGARVSDLLRTHDGRRQRIMCEQAISDGIAQMLKTDPDTIDQKEIAAFASRIYGLGLRSMASGWKDHASSCQAIADSLDSDLDSTGKRRRKILSLGRGASVAYEWLAIIKQKFKGSSPATQQHSC